MTTPLYSTSLESPLGPLLLIAEVDALCGVYLPEPRWPPAEPGLARPDLPILVQTARELGEYFSGQRRSFAVPTRARGTSFQRAVWAELAQIEFGETRSYADVARALAQPSATRAVGAANGKNPLSIVVPCHRVIGSDRSLTGYAGGVARKQWLLDHEARLVGRRLCI